MERFPIFKTFLFPFTLPIAIGLLNNFLSPLVNYTLGNENKLLNFMIVWFLIGAIITSVASKYNKKLLSKE